MLLTLLTNSVPMHIMFRDDIDYRLGGRFEARSDGTKRSQLLEPVVLFFGVHSHMLNFRGDI